MFLVLGLGGGDVVHDEPALHVIDDIHEPGGEPGVGPELAIDLDETLFADSLNLLHAEGVLQTVPEKRNIHITEI